MTLRSWIAAVPVAAMATLSVGGCGGEKATLDTFAGNWHAHARTLKITRPGNGHERFTLGLGSGVVVELASGLGRERWIIERTFAWLHNRRRLLLRTDRRHEIHEAFLALACCLICWRQLENSLG
jgi:hypothetical protein